MFNKAAMEINYGMLLNFDNQFTMWETTADALALLHKSKISRFRSDNKMFLERAKDKMEQLSNTFGLRDEDGNLVFTTDGNLVFKNDNARKLYMKEAKEFRAMKVNIIVP